MPILYQITGSSSFVARAALEESGAAYEVVDIAPKDRSGPPAFLEASPTRRVPALDDDGVRVFECAALLLYLADRYPDAKLGPAISDPARGEFLAWMTWTGNTLHTAYEPIWLAGRITSDEAAQAEIRAHGMKTLQEKAGLLDDRLAGRDWLVGDAFSLVDLYVYMLVGWQHYFDDLKLGGDALQAHYARVGARPAVARARDLDHLDERLIRTQPSAAAPS